MLRIAAIVLVFAFVALGSGALEYLHNSQHAHDDAAQAAADRAAGRPAQQRQPHDDSNCATHAQLRMPFAGGGWVPLLVFFGIFIAFLSEIAQPLISRPIAFNLDCRGPPAC